MNKYEKVFSQADQVVTGFTTNKSMAALTRMRECQENEESEETLLRLVNIVNSWITFLDLDDTNPRFKLITGKQKKAEVEIFYN